MRTLVERTTEGVVELRLVDGDKLCAPQRGIGDEHRQVFPVESDLLVIQIMAWLLHTHDCVFLQVDTFLPREYRFER